METSRSTTISKAMELAGVPRAYLDVDPRPDLLDGVFLTGRPGRGKTHAACGAIRAYVGLHVMEVDGNWFYRGPRPRFVNAPQWFAQMRATYDRRGESEQEVFDRYATCGLLVLDDLGKGGRSEWAVERIYMLMDHRSANGLTTIVTSNYDLGELSSMLSTDQQTMEAVASRIAGMCRGVRVDGPDRRLGKNF